MFGSTYYTVIKLTNPSCYIFISQIYKKYIHTVHAYTPHTRRYTVTRADTDHDKYHTNYAHVYACIHTECIYNNCGHDLELYIA